VARVDDVVIVSGHNIGTAEVESAVVLHPAVAEAAVVGVEHSVKGYALYVFVVLVRGWALAGAARAKLGAQVCARVCSVLDLQVVCTSRWQVDKYDGDVGDGSLAKTLGGLVRAKVGAFASPDTFHFAPGLPKTRSGKIMRRILRKVAALGGGVTAADLGDTSTLADPAVVADLVASHASVRVAAAATTANAGANAGASASGTPSEISAATSAVASEL